MPPSPGRRTANPPFPAGCTLVRRNARARARAPVDLHARILETDAQRLRQASGNLKLRC
jgi:hypothetical protein